MILLDSYRYITRLESSSCSDYQIEENGWQNCGFGIYKIYKTTNKQNKNTLGSEEEWLDWDQSDWPDHWSGRFQMVVTSCYLSGLLSCSFSIFFQNKCNAASEWLLLLINQHLSMPIFKKTSFLHRSIITYKNHFPWFRQDPGRCNVPHCMSQCEIWWLSTCKNKAPLPHTSLFSQEQWSYYCTKP